MSIFCKLKLLWVVCVLIQKVDICFQTFSYSWLTVFYVK